MNPYRSIGSMDVYPDRDSELHAAKLVAIPWTDEARNHRMDRFSWINLRHLITEGPDNKVALTFHGGTISYVYPSFWDLQRDIRKIWSEAMNA